MEIVFIGSSDYLGSNVQRLHISGPMRRSAVRAYAASKLGYEIAIDNKLSPDGKYYTAYAMANGRHNMAEPLITEYILKNANWKFVRCQTWAEAKEFAKYAIEQFKPFYGLEEPWNRRFQARFDQLMEVLNNTAWIQEIDPKTFHFPGIYLFGNP